VARALLRVAVLLLFAASTQDRWEAVACSSSVPEAPVAATAVLFCSVQVQRHLVVVVCSCYQLAVAQAV